MPILNKLLIASGTISDDDGNKSKPYSVVRVETSSILANTDSEKDAFQEDLSDSEDEGQEESSEPFEMVVAEPVEGGQEDLGKGVAHKNEKIGSTSFRGVITKVSISYRPICLTN